MPASLRRTVLGLFARAVPLPDILGRIVALIEARVTGDGHVALLQRDPAHEILRIASAPTLPPSLLLAIDRTPVSGAGPLAAALARHEPVRVRVDQGAGDLVSAEVATAGLAMLAAVPVESTAGEGLGVLVLAHRTEAGADAAMELLQEGAFLAAVAIERQRAEARRHLLEVAIEHANDAVLITEALPLDDPGPRIVYANPAFERMTGWPVGEVLGRTPRILQGPETDRGEVERIRRALVAGEPVRAELLNYRRDGGTYWVELDITPVAEGSGWFTHFVSVQRDITVRSAERAALRRLDDKLAELRARGAATGEPEDGGEAAAPGRPRVLLVDDEPGVLRATGRLLEAMGYDVTTAPSGPEGIAAAAATPPDVVILDLQMPGMDGRTTLLELRRVAPLVPVILSSGHAQDRAALSWLDGVTDFLQKPYTGDEIGRLLGDVLGR